MVEKKRTSAQALASKKNIKKAQTKWKSMSHRQHALAQPQGRSRIKPGTTGKGKYYRIEIRPKGEFKTFRIQDVGEKGGVERLAGKRSSGSRDTVSWLVSKEDAHMTANHTLVITDPKARSILTQIRGPIKRLKGDVFTAHPRKNIPEKDKPTPAMKLAEAKNIKKAQAKRKAMHAKKTKKLEKKGRNK